MKNILFLSCVAIFFASCMNNSNTMKSGNSDLIAKNKARMQEFYDKVFNAHNPAMVDSFCTADFVEHSPAQGYNPDRDGLKKFFTDYFTGFPDIHASTTWMVADSDMVITLISMTGTNSGPMMGMPATNKSFNTNFIDAIHIKDGKADAHWGYGEEMKMMTQLGLMPDPNAPKDDKSKMDDKKKK